MVITDRQAKRSLTRISSAHQTYKAVIIQIAIPLQNVALETVQAYSLLQIWEAKHQFLLKGVLKIVLVITGNLHLKLICAIRAPRIWSDCIEVSWWGTVSPAANLSSFSQPQLCKNIYSYPILKSCRYGRYLWKSTFLNHGTHYTCCL